MKKRGLIGIIIVAILILVVGVIVIFWPHTFELSAEYQDKVGFSEINTEQLKKIISEKKSFALFIYQPGCITSEDFEKRLASFSENQKVSFEKIKFSDAKGSGLVSELRYYPSVALYRDGELVAFLRTDRNDDMAAYDTEAGFTTWWHRYVK